MRALDRDALASVIGAGESSTRLSVGPVAVQRTTSDYQACVGVMREAAATRYPNNGFWPVKADSNAAPRAAAQADYVGRYCGPPPR